MKRRLVVAVAALVALLASTALVAVAAGTGTTSGSDAGRSERVVAPPGRGRPAHAGPSTTTTTTVTPAPALRLHHLQSRGTHNSTHLDPGWVVTDGAPFGWGYSHRTLTAQLEEQGVRQVELDVHWNWARDDFDVYHVWFGDDRATCDTLTACLAELRAWSDDHPHHAPLLVLVEPKDGIPPAELPEDGDPFTAPFDDHAYARLDEVLAAGFGDRALTPDEVATPGRTLRDSVVGGGWPRLDDVRQHAVFLLDGDDHATRYSAGYTSLAGRTMFVQAPDDTPVAAFVGRDGARLPGEGKYDRIARLVAQGFLVRDLVSPDGFEVAAASGAHFLSTDHPEALALSSDPAAPSRCNPVSTAAIACTDVDVERHEPHGYAVPEDPGDGPDRVVADRVDRLVVGTAESAGAAATADPGTRVPPVPAPAQPPAPRSP